MEAMARTVSTELGEVLVNVIAYPNKSLFVWVSRVGEYSQDDFHAAAPSDYSEIPSVTTRSGDSDSVGRSLSMKLAKRYGAPVVVSWSLAPEFEAVSVEIQKEICALVDDKQMRNKAVLGV